MQMTMSTLSIRGLGRGTGGAALLSLRQERKEH